MYNTILRSDPVLKLSNGEYFNDVIVDEKLLNESITWPISVKTVEWFLDLINSSTNRCKWVAFESEIMAAMTESILISEKSKLLIWRRNLPQSSWNKYLLKMKNQHINKWIFSSHVLMKYWYYWLT